MCKIKFYWFNIWITTKDKNRKESTRISQRRTKFSNTAAIGGESAKATSGSSNSTGKQGKGKGWHWNCAAALCTNNWRNKDSAYYTPSKIGPSTDAVLYMKVLKYDDVHWNKAVICSQHWSKVNRENLVYDLQGTVCSKS